MSTNGSVTMGVGVSDSNGRRVAGMSNFSTKRRVFSDRLGKKTIPPVTGAVSEAADHIGTKAAPALLTRENNRNLPIAEPLHERERLRIGVDIDDAVIDAQPVERTSRSAALDTVGFAINSDTHFPPHKSTKWLINCPEISRGWSCLTSTGKRFVTKYSVMVSRRVNI